MQLVKDASSKPIVFSDANAVVLRSTPSNGYDTQYRASKGVQNVDPTACSNNVKESNKIEVYAPATRLPLTTSDNAPNLSRSGIGTLLLRRIETTNSSSGQSHSATVPTSATTVPHPIVSKETKEVMTTAQLGPVPVPINDQPCTATGSIPVHWPVTPSSQVAPQRPEYISSFLHGFTERVNVVPTHSGFSLSEHSVHAWMYWVLATVSDPRSEQAKGLLRGNPGGVLFAAQLQLATAWSREIEEMAQRATTRDYYYDLLMRACGHARAKEWVTGRGGDEDGGRRRRTGKGSGGLTLRKRVLVGQGFKVYNEMVRKQSGEDPVSTEV